MARRDALLRLHARLLVQRDDLRQKLSHSFDSLENDNVGDLGEMALHDVERELESQLVSLESRELHRIEKAIDAIREGTYGQCEHCDCPIPIARLQALPHTTCCVGCQEKFERRSAETGYKRDWESAWDYASHDQDREFTMKDIQREVD